MYSNLCLKWNSGAPDIYFTGLAVLLEWVTETAR